MPSNLHRLPECLAGSNLLFTWPSHRHLNSNSIVPPPPIREVCCFFFCRVPGHTGLPGNEAADAAAKAAGLHGTLVYDRTLGSDVRTFLHRALLSSWQDEWDNPQENRLRMVKPSVQVWQSSFGIVRKKEVSLTRLRIGHTRVTHGHLLPGEAAPVCRNCGVPLTVSQILVYCPRYGEARHISHLHGALSDVLGDDRCSVSNVSAFTNATGLSTSI
jgi:hypothetical protein